MTPVRNYDIPALRQLDMAHHLPAQSSYGLQVELGGSRIITQAQGSTLTDGDGVQILDGMAGLWCVNVGYGRPELVEVAARQMAELPYYNTFFRTATVPPIELAAKLAGLLGGDLQHVFFNNSGSESNDTVFRLVRTYWSMKGQPQRQVFISRHNAYHGSTVASASLGGMDYMHVQGGLPIPDDKIAVPKGVFGKLLALALTPPRELMRLPFTATQPKPPANAGKPSPIGTPIGTPNGTPTGTSGTKKANCACP